MLYVLILCNMLSFAVGPALQAIVSKATDPREQGALMGSLQSLGSLAIVVVPVISTGILAEVSHFPANDWRIGTTFYLSAFMQALALFLAWRYFATHRQTSTQASA
jgi:DHA1 family tetracycline resistance protein-like MFS transporter